MTLIVGMYYDNKKGAIIASDSQATKGTNSDLIRKISKVNGTIVACCGSLFLTDALKDYLGGFLEDAESEFEIRNAIEQAQKFLADHYVEENEVADLDSLPTGIYGFCTEGKPKIYRFFGGVTEGVDNFIAEGNEYDAGEIILRECYDKRISEKEAIDLAVYSIMGIAKNNVCIDENIQIAVIKKNGWEIWNENEEGDFNYKLPKILRIKKRMNEIYEKQKRVLEILLRGDKEDKIKLNNLFNKYNLRNVPKRK